MSLYMRESGEKSGSLIIFLHGGGVSGWMWDKQVKYFKDFHCMVPDLPEQGNSSKDVLFTIEESTKRVIELIEANAGGKKVTVIGFSLGAQILISILSKKPELIDYAVVNSALVRPMPLMETMIKPTIKLSMGLVKNKTFARLQAKELYIGEEYFEKYYDESKKISSDTLIRILQENMSFSLPKDFKNAKAKILVLIGEKEKKIMKKSAIDIIKSNSNCKGRMVPNVGHGISLWDPDLFNDIVDLWIGDKELPKGLKHILI